MKIRRIFGDFEPYGWEPSNEQIAEEFGLKTGRIIRFDTNTSPYTPARLLQKLKNGLETLPLNRYPDTSYSNLRKKLASYNSCSPDSIMVSNGADEALDIITKTFIDKDDEVRLSVPTYSYYPVLVRLMAGKVKQIKRNKDFSDDFAAIKNGIGKNTHMVMLCSPNNPTGNLVDQKGLKKLLETDCAVVIDEAYYEFSGKSAASLTRSYDNLIVVRTFSKAFSLAGLRVGYTIASEKTTSQLNLVRPPNSVGVISLRLAEMALHNVKMMKENVARILAERDRCIARLNKIRGIKTIPTAANFMLVRFAKRTGSEVYKKLAKRGLVVRDVSKLPSLKQCIRFSVGKPEENDTLLKAISEIVN
ncbi:MAG: histidinol-phosphate transaminase [Thaumarchaeota archaeon]|nr:histidinol-phosphate transaminase [Nitrososphaerota archaeon]